MENWNSAGFVLAALMALLAFICWRKAAGYFALLMESSSRLESFREQLRSSEAEYANKIKQSESTRDQNAKLEKQVTSLKSKFDYEQKKLELRIQELTDEKARAALQTDHLRSQVEAISTQLREAEGDLREAQNKVSYAVNQAEKKIQTDLEQRDKQLSEAKAKIRDLERSLKTSEDKQQKNADQAAAERVRVAATAVDPEKLLEQQRKTAHFESLYRSMRGLREMADERNKNWEVALRKLAIAVLSAKRPVRELQDKSIGPLVGEALDLLGERLIDDEFTVKIAEPEQIAR
jgi:chromosome segregation ATPase